MNTTPQLPHLLQFYSKNEQWVDRCLEAYDLEKGAKLKLINLLITKSYSTSLIKRGPISVQFDIVVKEFLGRFKK